MKISEQIKEVVKHKNTTITELAANIGTSQANLANKLVRDAFKLSDIQEIARKLGYDEVELVFKNNKEEVEIRENRRINIISKSNCVATNTNDIANYTLTPSDLEESDTYTKLIATYNTLDKKESLNILFEDLLKQLLAFQLKLGSLLYASRMLPDVFGVDDTFSEYVDTRNKIGKIIDDIYELHVGTLNFNDLTEFFNDPFNLLQNSKYQSEDAKED